MARRPPASRALIQPVRAPSVTRTPTHSSREFFGIQPPQGSRFSFSANKVSNELRIEKTAASNVSTVIRAGTSAKRVAATSRSRISEAGTGVKRPSGGVTHATAGAGAGGGGGGGGGAGAGELIAGCSSSLRSGSACARNGRIYSRTNSRCVEVGFLPSMRVTVGEAASELSRSRNDGPASANGSVGSRRVAQILIPRGSLSFASKCRRSRSIVSSIAPLAVSMRNRVPPPVVVPTSHCPSSSLVGSAEIADSGTICSRPSSIVHPRLRFFTVVSFRPSRSPNLAICACIITFWPGLGPSGVDDQSASMRPASSRIL